MNRLKPSAYWKTSALLPLLAFVAATAFGLIGGYNNPVADRDGGLLIFSLYWGMTGAVLVLPCALFYAVAAKYLKLRRNIVGILLSVALAVAAALGVAIIQLAFNPGRESWTLTGVLALTVLPATSAVAGAAASLLLPKADNNLN